MTISTFSALAALAALLPSGGPQAPNSRRQFFLKSVAPAAAALALTTTTSSPAPAEVADGTFKEREVSILNATVSLALGISAAGTGVAGFNRSKVEKKMASEMRDAQTTIKGLRELAEVGEPLPDVCIIKGKLRAEGAPVTPVVESTAPLRESMGTINQPTNMWLEAAETFGALKGEDGGEESSALREVVGKVTNGQISPEDVAFATEGASGAPLAVDAASLAKRTSSIKAGSSDYVLTELLVQRLFVHAYEKEVKDDDGDVIDRYNVRKPRDWSYNAHYARQQSKGLMLEGRAGEQARVRLPDFNFRSGEPPPLFLPVADVLSEAVEDFVETRPFLKRGRDFYELVFQKKKRPPPPSDSSSSKEALKASYTDSFTTPFTFLSNFLALDDMSTNDEGGTFRSQADQKAGEHALDELAAKSPSSEWVWNPVGFYDKTSYALAEHTERSVLKYGELKTRMPQARKENMQATEFLKTGQSRDGLDQDRDKEYGWRVSEIAVAANSPVALIARPVYEPEKDAKNPIVLVDPFDLNADGTIDDREKYERRMASWKFDMCFLSESVDELLVQKTANANAYIGIAVVGAFLAYLGASDLSYAASHPEAIVG